MLWLVGKYLNRERIDATPGVKKRQSWSVAGFTLIELMIAIVIVGILAGIGYPSYQNHIRATRRADAQSDLLQLAAFMERFFTVNSSYDQDSGGNNVVLPFMSSPQNTTNTVYNITFSQGPTTTSYTLRATPTGPQNGDGFLELTQDGTRRWDKNNNSNATDPGENNWEK